MSATADRELLELAAKAAGLQVKGWVGDRLSYFNPIAEWSGVGDWNPLDDEGDAFSLSVNLGLKIMHYPVYRVDKHSVIVTYPCLDKEQEINIMETYGRDKCKATRRAIVRAAAEMRRRLS